METSGFSKTMNNSRQQSKIRIAGFTAALAAFALSAPAARSQAQIQSTADGGDRITINLTDPSRPALVKAGLITGSITVKAYDGKDVIVEAHVRNRESSRTEGGMHRIPMTATGLSAEEENNEVRIGTDSTQRTVDLTITVPTRTSLVLHTINDGNISVTGVEGDLDINDTNGSVSLTNISGSAIAHALNGRILATFLRVDQKPMAFSSLNGNIDVTFPADLKANVSLRSDNGDVLSDFDVQVQPSAVQPVVEDSRKDGGKYRVKIDKTVHGTIGGGGPEIQFSNFNGNIYIRKAGAAH